MQSGDGDPQPPPAPADSVDDSLSLSSIGSTPSRILSIAEARPQGVFTDRIPDGACFWVEIHPKQDFIRNEYEADDEEFYVVGIVGEIGEGDDIQYEVQFEDDHSALVSNSPLSVDRWDLRSGVVAN
jgi:hypothetical protein